MNNNQQQKLQSTFLKGKWHFIIVHGVIGWGLLTAILFSIVNYLTNDTQFLEGMDNYFIIFPIGGIAWGYAMWLRLYNQYHKIGDDEL